MFLEASGVVRDFAPDVPVWHQGDPSEYVFVIRRGCVKVVVATPVGVHVVLGIRGPGDIVGELALVDRRPRRATVLTLGAVTGLMVSGDRFDHLLATRPAVPLAVARVLSERLAEADGYRLALAAFGPAAALARLVLDLAHRYGQAARDGGFTLALGLTQKDLADCLGVSSRTVARVVAAWRRVELISFERGSMTIPHPSQLQSHAAAVWV